MSAASATAVKASISTPVRPLTLQVAVISMAFLSGARARSTSTELSARGWHNGMRSGARFAPMMPASRATDSTSPFLTPPVVINFIVSGAMMPAPLATAVREVASFSVTSTMWALPCESKWVNQAIFLTPSGPCTPGHLRRRHAPKKVA